MHPQIQSKVQIRQQIPRQNVNSCATSKAKRKCYGKVRIPPQIPMQIASSPASPKSKSEFFEKCRNLHCPTEFWRVAKTIQQNGPRKLILGCFGASLGWGSGLRFQKQKKVTERPGDIVFYELYTNLHRILRALRTFAPYFTGLTQIDHSSGFACDGLNLRKSREIRCQFA